MTDNMIYGKFSSLFLTEEHGEKEKMHTLYLHILFCFSEHYRSDICQPKSFMYDLNTWCRKQINHLFKKEEEESRSMHRKLYFDSVVIQRIKCPSIHEVWIPWTCTPARWLQNPDPPFFSGCFRAPPENIDRHIKDKSCGRLFWCSLELAMLWCGNSKMVTDDYFTYC